MYIKTTTLKKKTHTNTQSRIQELEKKHLHVGK